MPARTSLHLVRVGSVACLLLAGCIAPVRLAPSRSATETGAAEARLCSFCGWRRCYQLSNGLVRVTNVPQVGGRTLEYSLGPYNFLFIGRNELGTTLADSADKRYRYFGGHFAQLHPEAKWLSLQSTHPPGLLMSAYQARTLPCEAGKAAIEMAAPPDLATGTQLVRTIELFEGSTRLRLTDTLTNTRSAPQDWGIHDILQLKGFPALDGVLDGTERPTGRLVLYVPLNPGSRFRGGVQQVVEGRGGPPSPAQWSTRELPGILTVRYRRQFGKALVDPNLPWIAFVDQGLGYAFVQRCAVPQKAILTAGGPLQEYPLIEVHCFAPVASLAPGGTATLVQDWYAARCAGPVLDVTEAGIVSSPLSLLRGGGKTWVAGTFGVFWVGRAAAVFRGAGGAELARVDCGPVSPLQPFTLDRVVAPPQETREVALEVSDAAGNVIGHLGKVHLGPP
jgi:hypothetical protein